MARVDVVCYRCRTPITRPWTDKPPLWCSDGCDSDAQREAGVASWDTERGEYAVDEGRRERWLSVRCAFCGQPFPPAGRVNVPAFCSPWCRRHYGPAVRASNARLKERQR